MKIIRLFTMLFIALAAMTSCKDDEPGKASQEQMQMLTGHWYAEIPVHGETDNWRSEAEGDVAAYEKIGAMIYLNGSETDACYWGYLFLKDNDMVNFDGIFRRDEEARFSIAMDSEGDITTSSHLADAPQVTNMHYDSKQDVITADVTFKGQTFHLTFKRPTADQEGPLSDYWEILQEEGIVGGFSDKGDEQDTNVSEDGATGPSRVRGI